MIKIVSNAEMRELDRLTIEKIGIPGMVLMENAGRAVFEKAAAYYAQIRETSPVCVFCGKGNNGGDGYVIARYFQDAGYPVEVISVCDPGSLTGDALYNYRICQKLDIPIRTVKNIKDLKERPKPVFIIDALLGTGIHGPAKGFTADVIDYINGCGAAVIAVDIPSGLSGDFKSVPGPVVRANITVTMALPKRAHLFEPARSFVGELSIVDIGIPISVRSSSPVALSYIESGDVNLPPIAGDENKYSAGKLFILAGSPGMTGAATLSALGASHIGTGLIIAGIPQNLNTIMETKLTEVLTHPLPETSSGSLSLKGMQAISERIDWSDALLIGPGLGRDPETISLVLEVCKICSTSNKPMVIDADALFAISDNEDIQKQLNNNVLLTPHHGEFIRLSKATKIEMASEPWRCVQKYLKDKACNVNLKGAPSLTAEPAGTCFVNSTGNPVLAKGGSGDVLAGICAGLMARGLSSLDAAISGNYIHGLAADLMAKELDAVSALPGDLLRFLSSAIKSVSLKR